MGARRLRPGTVKVSGLTPDNVRLLQAAAEHLPFPVEITPTTATFPCGAATAAEHVRQLIEIQKRKGGESRALHAIRRKLEKQVRPGEVAKELPAPLAKASKRLSPKACNHQQPEGGASVGNGRIKCLCCGLIWSTSDIKVTGERFTVEATGPAVTKEMIDRHRPVAPAREEGVALVAQHGTAWLVVELVAPVPQVVATCSSRDDAERIARALTKEI